MSDKEKVPNLEELEVKMETETRQAYFNGLNALTEMPSSVRPSVNDTSN